MSEVKDIMKRNKLLAQLKCSCDAYQVDSYSEKSLDANKYEHFKQEGHQAINTMKEETP